MIALTFFASILLIACSAILLVRGAKPRPIEPPRRDLFVKMFDELTAYQRDANDRMRGLSVKTLVTGLDVAQATDSDPRTIDYRFLGVMGDQDS